MASGVSFEGSSPFWRAWFAGLLFHRRKGLIFFLLALIWLFVGMVRLDIDFNVESLFPRDDAKRLSFNEYVSIFGRDDGFLILLCKAERLFDPAFLEGLERFSGELKKLGLFSEVYSLFDAPHAWMKDDMELGIGTVRNWLLLDGRIDTGKLASMVSSLSLAGPLLGNFLHPGSETAILLLRLSPEFSDNRGRMEATRRLREWLAHTTVLPCREFTLSGMPAARADGMTMIQEDQRRLLPISLVLTCGILFFFFRRWRDVGLVMAHVLVTLVFTLGGMGHFGLKFSILSSVTPVILVTTGSCYSVQIISRMRSLQAMGRQVSLEDLFASMIGPVFLANFTTVVGFASLFNTSMRLINEFAAITAAGVFSAFLLTFSIFPLLMVTFPGSALPDRGGVKSRGFSRFLLRIGCFVTQRPRWIVFGLLGCGLIAAVAAREVKVRAFVFDDFWPDSPLMRHVRLAENACRGILPMAVMIRAKGNEAVLRLHYMRQAFRVAAFLRGQSQVGKVDSPSDMISQVYGLLASDPAETGLPPDERTLAEVERLFLVSGGIDAGIRLVSQDLSTLQVRFRIRDLESAQAAAFIDRVRSFLAGLEDEKTTLRLTGTTVMIQESYRNIFDNLETSFAVVILFTFLVLLFTFRHLPSLNIGFWANLLPMVGVIGLMGVLNISFKPSTIMIFGIALGLAVDNTIYFMKEYWRLSNGNPSRVFLVRRALQKAGGGMIQSSFSLFFGFLVLLFSRFEGQFLIGLLLSFSVMAALVFDLFFVPAGLSLWGPRKT